MGVGRGPAGGILRRLVLYLLAASGGVYGGRVKTYSGDGGWILTCVLGFSHVDAVINADVQLAACSSSCRARAAWTNSRKTFKRPGLSVGALLYLFYVVFISLYICKVTQMTNETRIVTQAVPCTAT